MKKNNHGFAPIIILILLVLIAGGAYYFGTIKNKSVSTPVASVQPSSSPVVSPTADTTANWKTYTWNGISFKYPETWSTGGSAQSPLFYTAQVSAGNPNYKMTLYEVAASSFKVQINDPVGTRKEIADKVFEEKIADITVGGEKGAKIKTEVLPGSQTDARSGIAVRLNHNSKILNFEIIDPLAEETIIFDQILSTFQFTK